MELIIWSLVGGIVGTAFMDIADQFMDRLNFTKGYACGGPRAIGRWALGMLSQSLRPGLKPANNQPGFSAAITANKPGNTN